MKLWILLAWLCCANAHAHRYHAGMTEIGSGASGTLEVVHTYMTHDIEAVLARRARRAVDLSRPADEALLRAYLERRFYLLDAGGKRLPLRWVGIDARIDRLLVYQEARTPLAQVRAIHSAVLLEAMPGQLNTVNLRSPDGVQTLAFTRKLPRKMLR